MEMIGLVIAWLVVVAFVSPVILLIARKEDSRFAQVAVFLLSLVDGAATFDILLWGNAPWGRWWILGSALAGFASMIFTAVMAENMKKFSFRQ